MQDLTSLGGIGGSLPVWPGWFYWLASRACGPPTEAGGNNIQLFRVGQSRWKAGEGRGLKWGWQPLPEPLPHFRQGSPTCHYSNLCWKNSWRKGTNLLRRSQLLLWLLWEAAVAILAPMLQWKDQALREWWTKRHTVPAYWAAQSKVGLSLKWPPSVFPSWLWNVTMAYGGEARSPFPALLRQSHPNWEVGK